MQNFDQLVGKEVRVEFLDHVMGHDEPLVCRAWGKVAKSSSNCIVLKTWESDDEDGENDEIVTILTSAVLFVKVLAAT